MDSNAKEKLIIGGSLASVFLLVIYFLSKAGGNSSGDGVSVVYDVTAQSPETAAIFSNERIANINAQKDIALGFLGFKTAAKQSDVGLAATQIQSDAAVNISQINANSAITQTTINADVLKNQSNLNAQVAQYTTQVNAQAAQNIAKTNKKANAADILNGLGNLVSNSVSSVGKLFGL